MALKDVPSMIDYILRMTGYTKLPALVGYDMGSLVFLYGAGIQSMYYNHNVDFFVGINPMSTLYYSKGWLLSVFTGWWGDLVTSGQALGWYDQLPIRRFLYEQANECAYQHH